jgi:hypothetical protein
MAKDFLENMGMHFAMRDHTSNIKVRMGIFQLNGSYLLWWKTLSATVMDGCVQNFMGAI